MESLNMEKSEAWNWDGDGKESTVVQSMQEIAVYTNTNGDIVIRQEDPMGEGDGLIFMPRKTVEIVIKAIRAELKKEFTPE
jgi:hypothetical protein